MDDPQSATARRTTSISIPSPSSSQDSASVNSASSLLVREDDTDDESPLLFTQLSDDDSDRDDEDDDYYIPHDQRPLAPIRVVLLLVAPVLRLGAFLLPSMTSRSLAVSIPCLVLAGVLALFMRHLWVLLAHYVRKVTIEDVLCEALARLRSGRRPKSLARFVVRSGGTLLRFLLVTLYLKIAVSSMSSVLPPSAASEPILAGLLFLILVVLSPSTASISSSRTQFFTFLSCVSYITWLGLRIHGHVVGDQVYDRSLSSILQLSPLWDSLTVSLALFAVFPPLSIYASLSTYRYPAHIIGGQKKRRRSSFGSLSLISFMTGLAFILPLLFINDTADGQWETGDYERSTPAIQVARGLTLVFAIPETFATVPKLPWPASQSRIAIRRLLCSQIVPRSLLLGIATLTSFLPPAVTSVFTSIVLVLIILATYILPPVLHIIFHNFMRPTAIVLPRTRSYHVTSPQEAEEEEIAARLLNAKERKLQRKRLLRRISWDIIAWLVVIGSLLWVVGRIAHWWWWM